MPALLLVLLCPLRLGFLLLLSFVSSLLPILYWLAIDPVHGFLHCVHPQSSEIGGPSFSTVLSLRWGCSQTKHPQGLLLIIKTRGWLARTNQPAFSRASRLSRARQAAAYQEAEMEDVEDLLRDDYAEEHDEDYAEEQEEQEQQQEEPAPPEAASEPPQQEEQQEAPAASAPGPSAPAAQPEQRRGGLIASFKANTVPGGRSGPPPARQQQQRVRSVCCDLPCSCAPCWTSLLTAFFCCCRVLAPRSSATS